MKSLRQTIINESNEGLSFKDAIKHPKGGASKMTQDNLLAQAADSLSSLVGVRGEALYNWSKSNNIDLVSVGHKLAKNPKVVISDILNNTTNSLK